MLFRSKQSTNSIELESFPGYRGQAGADEPVAEIGWAQAFEGASGGCSEQLLGMIYDRGPSEDDFNGALVYFPALGCEGMIDHCRHFQLLAINFENFPSARNM